MYWHPADHDHRNQDSLHRSRFPRHYRFLALILFLKLLGKFENCSEEKDMR
jgi:hypothetical protein